jgi:hypothetical protein
VPKETPLNIMDGILGQKKYLGKKNRKPGKKMDYS